ncbi:MAG: DNA-directed RNA polymerase subunit beta [SAR324 cluster bacterium]|nr:DNA-directed RNA polymerase subunit beta [SAR324 cluster bacterium]
MSIDNPNVYRYRLNFGKIPTLIGPPHLLHVQKNSFEEFLQADVLPLERKNQGLEAALRGIFPIVDNSESHKMEYLHYTLGEPKFDERDCRARGVSYSLPLRVTLRLIYFDKDSADGVKKISEVKEQDVYFGDFPTMTGRGSFIINGTERVIVSQLHKSPGIFFRSEAAKGANANKPIFSAQILPQRGSWINFEFDNKDFFNVRFDKKPRFLGTYFLRALGYTEEELIKKFYISETIFLDKARNEDKDSRKYFKGVSEGATINQKTTYTIQHPKTEDIIVTKGRKINKNHLRKLKEAGIDRIEVAGEDLLGRFIWQDISDSKGELVARSNQVLTVELLDDIINKGIKEIKLIYIGNRTIGSSLRDTLAIDKIESIDHALLELYKKVRPGDVPTLEVAKLQIRNMFFNPNFYDLSLVGRMKLNRKLGLTTDENSRILTQDDILAVVGYLLKLKENIGVIDDIDHLSNRRVKTVGELVENRFQVGLSRVEKVTKERMSLQAEDGINITDVVNAKPLFAMINEFFGSSQLSQFMDQTNSLSEITHKRRLSALGPGGLARDRAGFEVRDVHNSHYGRICPIETPEGPNIGLISSLACYARINDHGFIETPYREVESGKVSDSVRYLSAYEDDQTKIVQAEAVEQKDGGLKKEFVSARVGGEFMTTHKSEIEYMDLSPKQLVSVASSLIPFLEHDDANRALMGSNMQRQAVPLIRPQAPLVGTGMEHQVARDSGACVVAKHAGVVESVYSSRIVVEFGKNEGDEIKAKSKDEDEDGDNVKVDIYHLDKYNRSNQNTCIDNRPLVKEGDVVEEGQIIADAASIESGEIALGQNMLLAFMPWHGYNYEDSILVSERVLVQDRFTSVHIEELECLSRDTKLGQELITSDLPNVSEYFLKNLDNYGVIRVGSYVKSGDILVGKTTPKGESHVNPEDRLLRAIFGDKAADVRDTSLRVSQGIEGVVIDVKMYNRRGIDKDERLLEIERDNLRLIDDDFRDEIRIIKRFFQKKVTPFLKEGKLKKDLLNPRNKEVLFKKGTKLVSKDLLNLPEEAWVVIDLDIGKKKAQRLSNICNTVYQQFQAINLLYEGKIRRETMVDDLPPGVIRSVKVYVAVKRRLSVGDKMAGRHGNKGVISRIIPVEDMPYLADGRAVDIALNPLGVPSRMNVGQVLETQLGFVANQLGRKIDEMIKEYKPMDKLTSFIKKVYSSPTFDKYLAELSEDELKEFTKKLSKGVHVSTPVFDGATEKEIQRLAKICDVETHGKVQLFDGLTGDAFEQKVTVGYMYVMKLHHLADEKIHARSIGPYSLVTQQPLGGKAQRGGQRFGEMEVWALEAYGAAYALREMLTVKSDDVVGRNKVYESIVKGSNNEYSGIPESFKVLINELKALCLDFRLIKDLRFLDGES